MTFPRIAVLLIVIIWVALFAALLQRDYFVKKINLHEKQVLTLSREESYLGVYFQGERIGYVQNRYSPRENGSIRLLQNSHLLLNILGQSHPVDMNLEADLSADYLLQSFSFELGSTFYQMNVKGTIEGNSVHYSLSTGKEDTSASITLKAPPILPVNQRGYLLKQDLKPGDKIRIPFFDPITLSGKETTMEYRGKEKVLIHNRVLSLHRFIESYAGIRINSWLDDQGKVIKEESPAGFIFLAEPEFKARDITGKGEEILGAVAVPFAGDIPDLDKASTITFRLTLPEGSSFDLNGDRQIFQDSLLTVTRETIPEGDFCRDQQNNLKATPFIQTNNQEIAALAEQLTRDQVSSTDKVRAISTWLYTHIDKQPVISIPDALSTLKSKKGDCNEHAVLFASLARNSGIPTRIASGVMYHAGKFYYHAWNEVCISDTWLSIDTTKNQIPADLSHIKFIEGGIRDQTKIISLLGNLGIELVNINMQRKD
ncbi:MAG: transglutaminase domain-containing protein [Desulfobulbaceae bacterium]|uniref:Transglutaminase domain-containing protein n=1 Tax=Candidatus Desulfobia pelagia TaxID=2841692 RepID=A0A8J6NDV1_9BACT|nr:transglutaminase domain-containing protein [Candidatus Desulfobia pelagia]